MNLLPGIDTSASALQAERIRLEVISQNIANANVTRTEEGGPYQRQVVRFETVLQNKLAAGSDGIPQRVQVADVLPDGKPPRMIFQPEHPDADKETGMVALPNVNVNQEMADMIAASRSFEANLAVIKNARAMTLQTLSLGRHS